MWFESAFSSKALGRWVVTGGVVLFLLGAGCEEPVETSEAIRPVRTITVGEEKQLEGRAFPGQAEANEEVNLSFRVAGTLMELPVKTGDVVEAGQLLAKLDPQDFEVRLQAADGELASTEANLELAKTELKRYQDLFKKGAAPEVDATRAEQMVELQKGILATMTSKRDIARNELAYTELTAPFDGQISFRYVENFQEVQIKQPIFRLLDTSRLKFGVDLPEAAMPLLHHVKEIWVSFQAIPGQRFQAKIHEISNEASRATRTYRLTVVLDQPSEAQILPGMSGELRATLERPDTETEAVHEIPATALFESSDGTSSVWILDSETMTVRRQQVKTERLTPAGMMVENLSPGQIVVTAGVHYLNEGLKVRVLETPGDAPDSTSGSTVDP